ncbi:unnamed protein product [Phytophthora fragariaefolia]|uniref:Unnamed protein product n=1 Tax=Phytophthora fragariaefolia TaxID=1490495 RepID=A0A9W7D710_9STRA|nr:unnamed protein product [Phytophthora fragariaefolia]
MGKNSGSTNYTMFDIDRLLHHVEQTLPLGRDEWGRLAMSNNAGRTLGAPERDFENLHRKYKMLYSARKPTGMPEMPSPIKRAKEVKQAIDDNANVIKIDDEADRDQGFVEPDFSFEADPDDDFFKDGEGRSLQHGTHRGTGQGEHIETDESVDGDTTGPTGPSAPPIHTPRPVPLRPLQNTWQSGSSEGPPKTTKGSINVAASNGSLPTGIPLNQGSSPGNPKKDLKYKTSSNRLGGTDLTSFRGAIGTKRAFEEDKETLEASFAKAKRKGAMKTTTALKNKLAGLESITNTMCGSIMETILLLREENEKKAKSRRADEEKRRREERAEAEERRRPDKLEMEERARCDREEARARTQEFLILIGAMKKKD